MQLKALLNFEFIKCEMLLLQKQINYIKPLHFAVRYLKNRPFVDDYLLFLSALNISGLYQAA